MSTLFPEFEQSGYVLIREVVSRDNLLGLRNAAETALKHPLTRSRRGSAYGLRNLFHTMPSARVLAQSTEILSLIQSILGNQARAVKGILFDKTEQANWAVPWHQDLTISVKEHRVFPGFELWSEKDGIPHVQPPVDVLEGIVAVRIHLDDCPASNGALRVIPGSHRQGRLSDQRIEEWKLRGTMVTCVAAAGDLLLMRPLLLHSSTASEEPNHRRVLHFEYSASQLPGGLEWSE